MNFATHMTDWTGGASRHSTDDAAVIHSAQSGNRDSFSRMISAYDATVFRLAWNYTQSASAATDIYQTVFTTAYRLMPSYTGDSFLIWLFRIATRCCLAYRVSPVPSHAADGPDDARISFRLRQPLMQLSARDRLVFVMRHELQFKAATIARMLDTDEHTVQSSLTRAFLMLRSAARGIGTRQ